MSQRPVHILQTFSIGERTVDEIWRKSQSNVA